MLILGVGVVTPDFWMESCWGHGVSISDILVLKIISVLVFHAPTNQPWPSSAKSDTIQKQLCISSDV